MSTVKAQSLTTIQWLGDDSSAGYVRLLDQRDLPLKIDYLDIKTIEQMHSAIFTMAVRGAPAIGAAGAYGMALGAFKAVADNANGSVEDFVATMTTTKTYLDSSRPTAVNLEWATHRMMDLLAEFKTKYTPQQLAKLILMEAKSLAEEDIKINRAIGDYGASIAPQKVNFIHHCNTGSLATVGHGTALGVIYSSFEQGKDVHVYVDETRPRLQGAKLTTFELQSAGIPFHLVPDGASSHLMYEDKVNFVVFGADRVASNGDVANKIGTSNLAICAHEYNIPVYACVPTPTIDINMKSGREIHIELRDGREITHVGEEQIAPHDCPTYNPAFDVTPNKYLTGIITEEGICYPPFTESLPKAKKAAEERIRAQWKVKVEKYSQQVFE